MRDRLLAIHPVDPPVRHGGVHERRMRDRM